MPRLKQGSARGLASAPIVGMSIEKRPHIAYAQTSPASRCPSRTLPVANGAGVTRQLSVGLAGFMGALGSSDMSMPTDLLHKGELHQSPGVQHSIQQSQWQMRSTWAWVCAQGFVHGHMLQTSAAASWGAELHRQRSVLCIRLSFARY